MLRNVLTETCKDGFVIAFCLTITLEIIRGGREVFYLRKVHIVSKNLLTNFDPFCVRTKAEIPYDTIQ